MPATRLSSPTVHLCRGPALKHCTNVCLSMPMPSSCCGQFHWRCGLHQVMRAYRLQVTPVLRMLALSPVGLRRYGLGWGLRLKNPVGSGSAVRWSITHNHDIQGAKQRDPLCSQNC